MTPIRRRMLLAAAVLAPSSARSQQPAWLDTLMARLATSGERRATFEEERRIAALSRALHSHGVLVWRPPDHLEKTTIAPRPENLVVDGDRITLSSGAEAPRTLSLASQPQLGAIVEAIRGPLAGDLAGLRRVFTIAAGGSEAAWRITLAPIDPAVAALVAGVAIAGEGTTIRTFDTVQSNGDTQHLAITDQPTR